MSDKPIDADCAGKLTILPGERVDELQQAGLRILQKEQGFRFGMDAVLLSSFVRAESRDRCADFGTGTGILPLLLAGMGRAKSVDAFEIQPDMADMARRSVRLNGLEHIIRIHALPVESADEVLAPGSIDVIVCNPPYGHHGTTLPNPAQTLSLARHQQKSGLTAWFKMAYHLLRGKGRMAVIYPAARMLEGCAPDAAPRTAADDLRAGRHTDCAAAEDLRHGACIRGSCGRRRNSARPRTSPTAGMARAAIRRGGSAARNAPP